MQMLFCLDALHCADHEKSVPLTLQQNCMMLFGLMQTCPGLSSSFLLFYYSLSGYILSGSLEVIWVLWLVALSS